MRHFRSSLLLVLALMPTGCGGGSSPDSGTGGAATGGSSSGGGGAGGSTGGTLSTGGATGGVGGAPSTGGQLASGGSPAGGASSGGASGGAPTGGSGGQPAGGMGGTGGQGGGDNTGGSGAGGHAAVFTCPQGLEALTPALTGKSLSSPISGVPEIVNNGGFLEGPVWYEGKLYMSQLDFSSPINHAQLLVYTPDVGFEVFIADSGTNGLALGRDLRLYGASQVAAGIVSFDIKNPSAPPQDVARMYNGATFNSPNDITIRSDGTVYFSDPNGNCGNCTNQPVQGLYRVPPGGQPELIPGAPSQPNGVTLSPDEQTLYVGGTNLMAFTVLADGSLGTGVPFGDNITGVDGMVVDCAGNLYLAMHSLGMLIALDPAGTQLPGSLSVTQPTNVAFGGPENRTLYVTSFGDNRGQLLKVDLEVPGFPF